MFKTRLLLLAFALLPVALQVGFHFGNVILGGSGGGGHIIGNVILGGSGGGGHIIHALFN